MDLSSPQPNTKTAITRPGVGASAAIFSARLSAFGMPDYTHRYVLQVGLHFYYLTCIYLESYQT